MHLCWTLIQNLIHFDRVKTSPVEIAPLSWQVDWPADNQVQLMVILQSAIQKLLFSATASFPLDLVSTLTSSFFAICHQETMASRSKFLKTLELQCRLGGRVDRVSSAETVNLASIPGQAKQKTPKIGIHCFPA